ncbi:MAG: DUF302 domain-containing protein [Gemmatimonadales bacterium]|jgi:uncharacterized protein (DUF302 family)
MSQIGYGYQKTLSGVSFDDALSKVAEELKKEGFGVLTEIDVKNTLKQKLDVDFRRYKILGACNPNLAHQALDGEAHIGLLLPCNVVVQETDKGDVVVSIADPKSMFALVNNEDIAHVAEDVATSLRRVLDAL